MIPLQTITQTLQAMLEQTNRMEDLPSALERDLLLSRIRTLYQMIIDMPVATAEQLQQMQEDFSPEIEVEFEFSEDDEQDDALEQDEADSDSDQTAEVPLPCPHHGEAPLSALVENIEQEINEPEELRAQACHNAEQNCREESQTIELIAAEIAEIKLDEASPCEQMQNEDQPEKPQNNEGQESQQKPVEEDEPEQEEPSHQESYQVASEQEEIKIMLFGQPISQTVYQGFVDELFNSDNALYTDHTAQIGAMESLDDALIFISENHSWHPQSDAAQQFIALLEERFA